MAAIVDDLSVLVDDGSYTVGGFNPKQYGASDWLVQIAFDLAANGIGSYFTLDSSTQGLLNNANYTLAGDVLVDVTPYVRNLNIKRGRSRQLEKFTSGAANLVLDNRDRIFDPLMESSPFYGSIVPRKEIQISRRGQLLYVGNIEDWNFGYTLDGDATAEPSCVDGFAYFAPQEIGPQTNTSQTSGARVAAILTQLSWPTARQNVATGKVTVDADAVAAGTNALSYLQKVEISEVGAFFMDRQGMARFRDRTELQAFTSGTTFGEGGIPFQNIEVSYGTEELWNKVSVTYTSGGAAAGTVTAENLASQTSYGEFAKQYDTILAAGSDATAMATWQAQRYSQPTYRINGLQVNMDRVSTEQAQQVLSLELGDVVLVSWLPNNLPPAVSQYVTVDGIEHQATQTTHFVSLRLSETYASFILDNTTFGQLNDDILGF